MVRRSCLTGRSPGSVFGLTRRDGVPGSLMTMSSLRVHRLSCVSCGSVLTGRNANNTEEREREPDEEDAAVSIRLGVQEMPRRRKKADGGGHSYLSELPPSMCSRTASNVRPGIPHHWWHPSE
ncbi:hypothetical protein D1007_06853 [Hordeum vulgare]|nr:hypothetical protein D1007_06853 [Hordeum vulgare]